MASDEDDLQKADAKYEQQLAKAMGYAKYEQLVAARNNKIVKLRNRSGLSMDELAKAMGYAGQSSIQRYLSPFYEKGFRPEVARRFYDALIGRGDPPITDADLQVFFALNLFLPGAEVFLYRSEGGPDTDIITADKARELFFRAMASGKMKATLPVAEGEISIEIPKLLSPASAETARIWLAHLINLAADAVEDPATAGDEEPHKNA
jgi:transcriptional regulator with XRE-family HTH domain